MNKKIWTVIAKYPDSRNGSDYSFAVVTQQGQLNLPDYKRRNPIEIVNAFFNNSWEKGVWMSDLSEVTEVILATDFGKV